MMYDPRLCYILDGVLGLYGLFITGMFIREKVSAPTHTPSPSDLKTDPIGSKYCY